MSAGMSAAHPQPLPEATVKAAGGRSALAHLLHALNQPLTGLQCSLELALMGSRTPEQHVRALRDGLELTARMRVLVEAIRELADSDHCATEQTEVISLYDLLQETVRELQPVAEVRHVRIRLEGQPPLAVQASRAGLTAAAFRFLEAALSLAAVDGVLDIRHQAELGEACVCARWDAPREAPEHSPFSPPELGLLLAQAAWMKVGATWTGEHSAATRIVKIRLPLVSNPTRSKAINPEVVK